MAVCENCPVDGMLRAAEKLVLLNSDHYPDSDQVKTALGIIAMGRESLEAVFAEIPCQGRATDSDSKLVCPLSGMAQGAQNFAFGAFNPKAFTIDPQTKNARPDVVDSQPSTGQYL